MRTAALATACGCAALTSLAIFAPAHADSRTVNAAPTPKQSSPPPAAQPNQACQPQTKAEQAPTDEPWAQKRLGFERVWPLTMGQGVTVAVIDSGVQPDHPMLAGRVPPGQFIDLTNTGKRDCVGHGTKIASLIGGRDMSGQRIPLSGVAPEAQLLIVKVTNASEDANGGTSTRFLPQAIREAVRRQAKVINISIRVGDSPALAEAVRFAQKNDAVVVAAGGNTENESGKAFPASYAGVLSVASLGEDGARVDTSTLLSRVDVGAPGKGVYAATTQNGYDLQAQGTSHAAAFASGVASLVRSRHPGLSAAQVVHRIQVTADGNAGEHTGRGMVDPVQAVTAVLPEEDGQVPAAGPSAPAHFVSPPETDHRTRTIAIAVTGGALGFAGLAALAGVVIPMGRRRGWRPGRVTLPLQPLEEEAENVGPEGGTIGSRS